MFQIMKNIAVFSCFLTQTFILGVYGFTNVSLSAASCFFVWALSGITAIYLIGDKNTV